MSCWSAPSLPLVGLIDNLAGRVELEAFIAPQAW